MSSPQPFIAEDEARQIELALKKADLKLKKWDLAFKVAGLLALLFGIIWPLYQYTRTLEKERHDRNEALLREQEQKVREVEAALREARKPFLQRQQELYFEATSVAAKLCTLEKGPEWQAAKKRFYQLYWGEMSVVEDRLVEGAMANFEKVLDLYEIKEATESELQQRSLELARSCQKSLATGWGYDREAAR
jgi:hypothetical protein